MKIKMQIFLFSILILFNFSFAFSQSRVSLSVSQSSVDDAMQGEMKSFELNSSSDFKYSFRLDTFFLH